MVKLRFYRESDNGSHYVVDRYADPLSNDRRTDCESKTEARKLAKLWNESQPWPAWDTIQEELDKRQNQI